MKLRLRFVRNRIPKPRVKEKESDELSKSTIQTKLQDKIVIFKDPTIELSKKT